MRPTNEALLPGGSDQENLEVISRNRVVPLFDPGRFILSTQSTDNGIDLHGELKLAHKKLGYAFKVQIKSRADAKPNGDGSFSKSLDTPNINYLWNQSVPAFYVFYVQEEDAVFYEYLTPFLRQLIHDKPDWESQESHVLRFSKRLDAEATNEIYQIVHAHGEMLREMRYRLATSLSLRDTREKVLIDVNSTVSDDAEIGKWVEQYGLYLCNEGKWGLVLEWHGRGSRSAVRSALYHLVVSLAYYYTGKLSEASVELRSAWAKHKDLPEDLIGTVRYFHSTVRLALGAYSKEEYNAELSKISTSDHMVLYLELERIVAEYAAGLAEDYEAAFSMFSSKANELLSREGITENLKLLIGSELLRFEGCRNNTRYARALSYARAVEEMFPIGSGERGEVHRGAVKENLEWATRADQLKRTAAEQKNPSALFTMAFYEARVLLEFDVIRCLIGGGQRNAQSDALIEQLLDNFDKGYEYFKLHDFRDNMIATLSLRYELLEYLGRDSSGTAQELRTLVDDGESKENHGKLKHLLDGGTTFNAYKQMIDESMKKSEEAKSEWHALVQEMEAMDGAEEHRIAPKDDEHVVELFPIGRFLVQASREIEAFEILEASGDAQAVFRTIWNLPAIPVANIHNAPLQSEGYGNGKLDDRGIESWRNIHRVRRLFFQRGFQRLHDPN